MVFEQYYTGPGDLSSAVPSKSPPKSGRFKSESVDGINRNGWTEWIGISGRNRPEYTFKVLGIDSDNDGAFINDMLLEYSKAETN